MDTITPQNNKTPNVTVDFNCIMKSGSNVIISDKAINDFFYSLPDKYFKDSADIKNAIREIREIFIDNYPSDGSIADLKKFIRFFDALIVFADSIKNKELS